MFRRILAAVDGSPQSHHLVPVLVDLVKSLVEPPEVTLLQIANAPDRDAQVLARQLAEIADNLDELARPLKPVTRVQTQITPGDPGRVICEVALDGYDLVVVGSRGLTDVNSLLLGSVSSYVSQHAPCPVMIVR